MPRAFHQLTSAEFVDLVSRFPFTRRIDAVHMHHTWRPRHRDYRGEETIVGMWKYHTETNHWSDIAQHVTIAPDGTIWTGRDWNTPPASSSGYNGNARVGPFMFETIGDFDRGQDRLEGAQLDTVLEVIAVLQEKFELPPESLRFHNQMSTKTCPGSSLDRAAIIQAAQQRRAQIVARRDERTRALDGLPFGEEKLAVRARADVVLRALLREERNGDSGSAGDARSAAAGGQRAEAEATAEPAEEEMDAAAIRTVLGAAEEAPKGPAAVPGGVAGRAPRDGDLPPSVLDDLMPHVINLNQGRFSSGGILRTQPEDVDAIFAQVERSIGDLADGERLRLLFYAHGGLNDERVGLEVAHKHVSWWRANRVYPIYFVWETGLCEQIGQLLSRAAQRVGFHAGSRAIAGGLPRDVADYTTDPLVEWFVRSFGGVGIWGSMKASARFAVDPEVGGARRVAERLKALCDTYPDKVELHAVGHSAGAIFHASFLATAHELGVPPFRTVQFLAPAVRVDTFQQALAPLVGNWIDRLTIYTMTRHHELADDCLGVYRKSLLYLIYYGLEPERREVPVLGLQACLTEDPALKRTFGLDGRPAAGQVVWSPSAEGSENGRDASKATSHGDFDDDAATMNSVACHVLDVATPDELVQRFERRQGARGAFVNCLKDFGKWRAVPEFALAGEYTAPGAGVQWTAPSDTRRFTGDRVSPTEVPETVVRANGGAAGRRRALCVGINRYPTAPLNGCVADAEMWAETLRALGFAPTLLRDDEATRSEILGALERLVTSSAPGDVIVFQFAGHGTELPDLNGDETSGNNGRKDEAICPIDFATGAFVIDDDVAEIFGRIPDGVAVTCFIDCCHSGTISRFAVGEAPDAPGVAGRSARYIVATPEMIRAHQAFRESRGQRGLRSRVALTDPRTRGTATMREVVFSACRDDEVAWENAGHGEFTLRATQLLRAGAGVSNQQFQERVLAAFGPQAAQHPQLDCGPDALGRGLLQPLQPHTAAPTPAEAAADAAVAGVFSGNGPAGVPTLYDRTALAHFLQSLADIVGR